MAQREEGTVMIVLALERADESAIMSYHRLVPWALARRLLGEFMERVNAAVKEEMPCE